MKKKTLRQFFTQATYLSVFLSAVCLCIVSTVLMTVISRQNLCYSLNQITERKSEYVERIANSVSETVRNIAYDEELQNMLSQHAEHGNSRQDFINTKIWINHRIQSLSMFFSQADNIVVYTPDGVSIGNKFGASLAHDRTIATLLEMVKQEGKLLWLIDTVQCKDHMAVECFLVTEIRATKSQGNTTLNDLLGYLVVQYNFDDILRALETDQSQFEIQLLNMDGCIICSTEGGLEQGTIMEPNNLYLDGITTLRCGDMRCYATARKIETPTLSLYCVGTVPRSRILGDVFVAIVSILMVSVIVMLSSWYITRKRAGKVCGIFEQMNGSFGLIEIGRLDIDSFPQTGILEVDELTHRFSHMADRLEQVMQELYESELHKQALLTDKREAELMAVRMQVNPHFLYNTLDTINWTALAHGDNEASEMVLMLGKLLRSSLSMSSTNNTIREELDRVKLFVQLEQKRFGEELHCDSHVPDELMEEYIPGMMLQILVENSISHGLKLDAGRGQIDIQIYMKDNRMCATVWDNGRGMPEHVVKELRHDWERSRRDPFHAIQPSSHIGLRNIMKRLRLLYGAQADFIIDTGDGGTSIQILYPKNHP